MKNGEDIRSYSLDELKAMRDRGESQTDWAKVDSTTQEELERRIAEDPEEAGIEWDWESAKLVMPQSKEHINLRVDADVLRFFKREGKGYQTRINAVLRSYMVAHQEKQRQR